MILEESEARIADGAAKADPVPDEETRLCGATVVREGGAEGACTLLEGHPGSHAGLPEVADPEE